MVAEQVSGQSLPNTELPLPIRSTLNRAKWRAQGRYEALWQAAEEHKTLAQIQAEIAEMEDTLTDPARVRGSLAMNMSPRLYAEGYWAGLQEVLCIMQGGQPGGEPTYPTPPLPPDGL